MADQNLHLADEGQIGAGNGVDKAEQGATQPLDEKTTMPVNLMEPEVEPDMKNETESESKQANQVQGWLRALHSAAIVTALSIALGGCVSVPPGVEPVSDFEPQRYMGTWYEIARLDHSFEKGLTDVTAEYSLKEDGTISVLNRGFNPETGEWQEAAGHATFVKAEDLGFLKISFFWPFYGSYTIFELDKTGYEYAFVAGNDREYLWLLSRSPAVSEELTQHFTQEAQLRGFPVGELIFVSHGENQQ